MLGHESLSSSTCTGMRNNELLTAFSFDFLSFREELGDAFSPNLAIPSREEEN